MAKLRLFLLQPALLSALIAAVASVALAADPPRLELAQGNKIVLIGNALAERMQYYGHWETLLHGRFPQLELVVRNLGWTADELTVRLRSKDFQNHGHRLEDHKPDVVMAAFGFNESFAGSAGLAKFKSDLDNFIRETTTTSYNGKSPPQLVLLSPIAHENLRRRALPDGRKNNDNIKLYVDAMAAAAEQHHVVFIDLFRPSLRLMESSSQPLTINGIHLGPFGDQQIAALLDAALFGPRPTNTIDLEKLRAEVNEKNLQHFYDYRAVNGYYIYGDRKNAFSAVNFPPEFAKIRKMVANRDQRVWSVAQGKPVPSTIDDSNTGVLPEIESVLAPDTVQIKNPAESQQAFKVLDGFEINLFASEVEFPDLRNPVAITFDARGRLWVATMATFPMVLPGKPVDDKVLILEDSDADGRADRQTVFADGLHVPTGLELGDGGLYLAQQPNLVFLKDTDGDDRADDQQIVLGGFDTADAHHSLHTFVWDPGGGLHFQEGLFNFTQVESPYGPVRKHDAGIFRFEPRTGKFAVFTSYPFSNPWGHYIDRWGQNLVADASSGTNHYGTALSGDLDYPRQHGVLKSFLTKQWRPTCGCELISSRHFPDEMQGQYLLNNIVGFQGVLRYKMREEGSGFAADPTEPLLESSDRNFRPVDLEFGPDGALYLADFYNPIVGHMTHSMRDPNRDHKHGRIWRIAHKHRPLVKPTKIDGASIAQLLDLLKTYEDRTRYRARIELGNRDTEQVMAELARWVAGFDTGDADYWHHMLEALWLHQQHDVVDQALLKTMLRSDEPKARAAATRVLCHWRDRVDAPLELLKVQAGDENARVRLEAVRAASFFHGSDIPGALEVATETLLHPDDDYLKYTLDETTQTLDRRAEAAKN
ncbi:MAG TPA: PVC-type heme-binding CxxCH protein [Pirellulales bacterium]|jgi:glucose/arabinose dehydrogenase|nr:PVC-type heme-binding CxxCH protein [Pirellulales bacterium]